MLLMSNLATSGFCRDQVDHWWALCRHLLVSMADVGGDVWGHHFHLIKELLQLHQRYLLRLSCSNVEYTVRGRDAMSKGLYTLYALGNDSVRMRWILLPRSMRL